jgi:Integrase core domain
VIRKTAQERPPPSGNKEAAMPRARPRPGTAAFSLIWSSVSIAHPALGDDWNVLVHPSNSFRFRRLPRDRPVLPIGAAGWGSGWALWIGISSDTNGKFERWHKTLKGDGIRVLTPLSLDDARQIVADYVTRSNTVRLHSAIGYITPQDKLAGREAEIFPARDRKLTEARQRRQ